MRRSLGGHRPPLLKMNALKMQSQRTQIKRFPDIKISAVIGSKGGSGEVSQVVDVITRTSDQNWLVVSINLDRKHEHYWQNNFCVTYTVADWSSDEGLSDALSDAEELGVNRLMLCIGLGSRAFLFDRVDRALGFCNEVFVTFNSSCGYSMSAVDLAKKNGIERCDGFDKLTWIDLAAKKAELKSQRI